MSSLDWNPLTYRESTLCVGDNREVVCLRFQNKIKIRTARAERIVNDISVYERMSTFPPSAAPRNSASSPVLFLSHLRFYCHSDTALRISTTFITDDVHDSADGAPYHHQLFQRCGQGSGSGKSRRTPPSTFEEIELLSALSPLWQARPFSMDAVRDFVVTSLMLNFSRFLRLQTFSFSFSPLDSFHGPCAGFQALCLDSTLSDERYFIPPVIHNAYVKAR
ncbi:hypothetical protein H4582DRAFT_1397779 [Lactarius indigo]|nr:hypothetical protein H4582DRAFT_1397779 [Lactarius indigo]